MNKILSRGKTVWILAKKMECIGNLGKIWKKMEYLRKIGILEKNLGKSGILGIN
jgi:hypothetical protein